MIPRATEIPATKWCADGFDGGRRGADYAMGRIPSTGSAAPRMLRKSCASRSPREFPAESWRVGCHRQVLHESSVNWVSARSMRAAILRAARDGDFARVRGWRSARFNLFRRQKPPLECAIFRCLMSLPPGDQCEQIHLTFMCSRKWTMLTPASGTRGSASTPSCA